MTVTKISVGPMDNNAYLLQTGDATLLIDAANDAHRLLKIISDGRLDSIVTTHRHGDHWQALPAVAAATGARLLCGQPDLDAIADGRRGRGTGRGLGRRPDQLGSQTLEVIGLVGHTPGSIALAYAAAGVTHLFTGDSLFPGRPRQDRDHRGLHLTDGRPGSQDLLPLR